MKKTKKPAQKPKHAPVVRSHDGGKTWEAACGCGYRSEPGRDESVATKAADGHKSERARG